MTFNDYPGDVVEDGYWDVAILGVPFDGGSNGVGTGQREGPRRVRELEAMEHLRLPYVDFDMSQVRVVDLGDVDVSDVNAGKVHDAVMATVAANRDVADLLITIGGDHSITPHIISGLWYDNDEPLMVIHADAHADTWEHDQAYLDMETCSHASWVRWLFETRNEVSVHQLGIRAFVGDESWFGDKQLCRYVGDNIPALTGELMEVIATNRVPVYLTVDLDVVDPSMAPGVVYPEPGGWTSSALLNFIKTITSSGAVKGIDIVECCPSKDRDNATVRLAHRSVLAGIEGLAMHKLAVLKAASTLEK